MLTTIKNEEEFEMNSLNDMSSFSENEQTNQVIKNATIVRREAKVSTQWRAVTQGNQQIGWNCFDVAVGMERQELVKYALDNAENIEARQLLAPEIGHAAAITAVYMTRKKEVSEREKKIEEERIGRIIELFQIAEALKDEREEALIEAQASQLLMASDDNSEKQELGQLVSYTLPKTMHTETLCKLVNDYYDAHEAMKETAAICNEALGYGEGKRLSLEELDKLFSEPINRKKYQEVYESFAKSRAQIFEVAEQKFKEHCENKDTYTTYVQGYYGTNQWFAFQRCFAVRHESSMVDIAACMLKAKIIIHNNQENRAVIYATQPHGEQEIHVEYNGINHFVKLEAVKLNTESVKEDVNRFELKSGLQNEGQLFQVKDDFYRLPQTNIEINILELRDVISRVLETAKNYKGTQEPEERILLELYGFALGLSQHLQDNLLKQQIEREMLGTMDIFIQKLNHCQDSKFENLRSNIEKFKKELENIRTEFNDKYSKNLVENISILHGSFSRLILNMFTYVMEIIGEPSCHYAMASLGSLATRMPTPYSDIEYIILVNVDKDHFPNVGVHLRNFCELFDFLMIGLGESPINKAKVFLSKRFNQIFKDIPLDKYFEIFETGMRVDRHKKPQVINHLIDLINTPKGLLMGLPNKFIHQPGNHLTSALLTTRYLWGDLTLYEEYQTFFKKLLPTAEYLQCLRQLLEQDIQVCEEEQNRLGRCLSSKSLVTYEKFEVKKFLTLGIHLARGLAIFLKICGEKITLKSNFFKTLNELKERSFITEKQYKNWHELVAILFSLRLALQKERKNAFDVLIFDDLRKRLLDEQKMTVNVLLERLREISEITKKHLKHKKKFKPYFSLNGLMKWLAFWDLMFSRKITRINMTDILIVLISRAIQYYNALLQRMQSEILQRMQSEALNKLYIFTQGLEESQSDEPFALMDKILEFINDTQAQVLWILGESGSGKTLFAKYITYELWNKSHPYFPYTLWQKNDIYFPIFVDLYNLTNINDIIKEGLEQQGVPAEQIEYLKNNYRFLWILDGYDRIYQSINLINLYQSNYFYKYKSKVMITCRYEYLVNEWAQYQRKLYIAPFSPKNIDTYIQKYVELTKPNSPWDNWKYYRNQVYALSELYSLVKNPLLLNMALNILPDSNIVNRYSNFSQSMPLTRWVLYEEFTKRLFNISYAELEAKHKNNPAAEQLEWFKPDPIKKLEGFAKRLAIEMYYQNTRDLGKDDIIWQSISDSARANQFRKMIYLLKTIENNYIFIHDSFLEYFIASNILELFTMIQPKVASFVSHPFNGRLLNSEPSIIQFLADVTRHNVSIQEKLWETIQDSRENAAAAIASSNAATILNAAKIPFSYKNLTKINISGADLSYGLLEGTQFQAANLTNVSFRGAWLHNADVRQALMQSVEFGEWPYIDFKDRYLKSYFYSFNSSYFVVLLNDILYFYNGDDFHFERQFNLGSEAESADLSYNESMIVSSHKIKYSDDSGSENFYLVRYWHINHHEKPIWETNFTSKIDCVRFYSNNSILVLSNSLYFLDLENGALFRNGTIENRDPNNNYRAIFSANLNVFGIAYEDGNLRIWSSKTGQLLRKFSGESGFPFAIGFSMDGKVIGFMGDNKKVVFWDVETGEFLKSIDVTGFTSGIAFNRNNEVSISNFDGSISIWDFKRKILLHQIYGGGPTWPNSIFSPDGKVLVTCGEDKKIRFWNIKTTQYPSRSEHQCQQISKVVATPSGNTIASVGSCGFMYLWDTETGKLKRSLEGNFNNILTIEFSEEDDNIIISKDHNDKTQVWYIGDEILYHEEERRIKDKVSRFPNGKEGLNLLNLSSFQSSILPNNSVNFILNGKKITAANYAFITQFWDPITKDFRIRFEKKSDMWSEFETFFTNTRGAKIFDFTPNGKILGWANNDYDAAIHLWDVTTGQELNTIRGIGYFISDMSFFENKNRLFLVTSGSGNSIRCFEIMPADISNNLTVVRLKWNSFQHDLYLQGANITGAHLTKSNVVLLKQHGAVGEPQIEPTINMERQVKNINFSEDLFAWKMDELDSKLFLDDNAEKMEKVVHPVASAATRSVSWVSSIKRTIVDGIHYLFQPEEIWPYNNQIFPGQYLDTLNTPPSVNILMTESSMFPYRNILHPIINVHDSDHNGNNNFSTLLHRPLDNVNSNMILGIVLAHLVKKIYYWSKEKLFGSQMEQNEPRELQKSSCKKKILNHLPDCVSDEMVNKFTNVTGELNVKSTLQSGTTEMLVISTQSTEILSFIRANVEGDITCKPQVGVISPKCKYSADFILTKP